MTDELRLAAGFGEALERLRIKLDEPIIQQQRQPIAYA
jgi:hypothetical protein